MTDHPSIEDRLDQLGRELKSAPSVSEQIREAVRSRPTIARETSSARGKQKRYRLMATVAVSAVLLFTFVWLSQPQSLYARTLAALKKVDTIHVTGWTTRIVRHWPLEESGHPTKPQKHPVDMWCWRAEDATPRLWQRTGPVIQNEAGPKLEEYQEDVDLLFLRDGGSKDYVDHLSTLAEELKSLDRPGITKESLGTRQEAGRVLQGLRILRGNRTDEYWFDSNTNLPMRFARTERSGAVTGSRFEMCFEYDQCVPEEVISWEPPKTAKIRYGSGIEAQQAWREHVASIGEELDRQGNEQSILLLDRVGETFALQYRLRTPDGDYWVVPVDMDQYEKRSLSGFIRLHAAGFTSHESWRAPNEFLDLRLKRQDLVYRDGTPWREWVQHLLNAYDLEFVDEEGEATFWIAHYDGRPLKPWEQVKAPVPYLMRGGEAPQIGVVRVGIGQHGHPVTIHELFEDFNRLQNRYLTADSPIIEDQTELPRPPVWDRGQFATAKENKEKVRSKYYVASDSPWFAGGPHAAESQAMAREWFKNEFGITFKEEKRPMTIHVIRRQSSK